LRSAHQGRLGKTSPWLRNTRANRATSAPK
jgi:hypothetical protein